MNEQDVKQKMQNTLDYLSSELATVRTGRANAALVENISVTYYDQQMPIKALANITTPDAKTINIAPWDPGAVSSIERALHEDKNLGLNPISDGKALFINVPPPTEERRKQLVKQVNEMGEQAQVSLRNIRHDELKTHQNKLKSKEISEDEFERTKKRLDELVQEYGLTAEQAVEDKKQDVLKV